MRRIVSKLAISILPIVFADVPLPNTCNAHDKADGHCNAAHAAEKIVDNDGNDNVNVLSNDNANETTLTSLSPSTSRSPADDSTSASPSVSSESSSSSFQCNIYLAPSSIPNAGFGLYTVRDIQKDEKVLPFTDAPSIPLCDEYSHGLYAEHWNHVDYLWSGRGLAEFECENISESVMTFGSLCNFHTYLTNVVPENARYDDTIGGGRLNNPGAGAFSYHKGHDFHADQDISAGDEIFCDYGEKWLDRRKGTFADSVPRYDEFETAARVFLEILRGTRENGLKVTDGMLGLLKNVSDMFDKRVASTFPVTKEVFDEIAMLIAEDDDSENVGDIAKYIAEKTTIQKHDVSWIVDNGICMEKIRPGISHIPHAGRGAFAQEFIPRGTMVVPAPLLNIVDRDLLKMYKSDQLIGKQLLLNYCFGHRDSLLLLCPQSNMILMNHRTCGYDDANKNDCGDEGPNAKIQWAEEWDPDTEDWLTMSFDDIEEMTKNGRRGLSFEVVALRDILPGEEVTIDYGENWHKAWEHHISTWEKPVDDGNYIPVRTMVDEEDYRTVEEQNENPYPENVMNVCYYPEGFDDYPEGGYEEDEWDGSELAPAYGMDAAYQLYPCEIIERDVENETYTIIVYPDYEFDTEKNIRLVNYPMESVSFRMMPYESDVHLPNAFRHYMEIPDDIFPDQWKNIS